MNDDIAVRLRDYFNSPIAIDAAEEIERLRAQLRLANIDNFNTTAEIERLRKERDEARREMCGMGALCAEAADEIERLRERIIDLEAIHKALFAEIVFLRSNLKDIADNDYNEPLSAAFADDALKGPHVD